MNEWVGIAIGLVLTVGTGLFVASEFALVNLDRHDLQKRHDKGESGLSPTINALKITSTHLSSAQLGITLTTLLTGYTMEPAISSLLADPLTATGVPEGMVLPLGGFLGIFIATLLSMIVGELVPKNFAISVPLATAKVVVPFQTLFTTVFRPIIALLNGSANSLIRMMGIEPQEELSGARTADELTYLIRHSATEGALDEEDAELLGRTLRFADYDAGDLMTHRTRMVTVHKKDTAEDILALAARTGHSRFPVVDTSPDDVLGVVHVKTAFAVPLAERSTRNAAWLMAETDQVPESMAATPLLEHLRGAGDQLALVRDEYGGTAGLVTLEDLVEEIVGQLEDEHDRVRPGLSRRGRAIVFDGMLRPDEVAQYSDVEIPEGSSYDTVGGWIAAELGRIPEIGDEVYTEQGRVRVERMDGLRVARVIFLPADPAERPGAEEEAGA